MKISAFLVLGLTLVGPAAFAQTSGTNTTAGPNGVTGAAPTRDVGTNPSVANTPSSATTSSSMEKQQQKQNNAAGLPATTNSNTK